MSQAGVISIAGSGGTTSFVENVGSAAPVAGVINILGGTGITTSGAGNTVTINATGSGENWQEIAISTAAVPNNGYIATAALTLTLPTAPAMGVDVGLIVNTAGAVVIQAAGGATIRMANKVSAANGTATNTAQGDSVELLYDNIANVWFALGGFAGNWNVV